MLTILFEELVEGPGVDKKGVETSVYWVLLMLGVTKLLGLGTAWITGLLISGVVLIVD